MRKHFIRPVLRLLAVTAAVMAAAAACNGGDGPDPTPAAVQIVSGNEQTGPVGAALAQPLVVRVTRGDGQPLAGVKVTWSQPTTGSVEPDSSLTDASGQASTIWTLGPSAAVAATVHAQVAGLADVVFTATPRAAAPATATATSPTQLTGTPGQPLADSATVVVKDQFGNPVAGATVNWTVSPADGSVSPAVTTTRADGSTKAQLRMGPQAVPYTFTAQPQSGTGVQFRAAPPAEFGVYLLRVLGPEVEVLRPWDTRPLYQWIRAFRETDTYGVSGVRVRVSGSGLAAPVEVMTGEDGYLADVPWTVPNQPGDYTRTYTLVSTGQPMTFTVRRPSIFLFGGGGGVADPGARAPDPFVIEAGTPDPVNPTYVPKVGLQVHFEPFTPGLVVDVQNDVTDEFGRARTGASYGPTPGQQVVFASVSGEPPVALIGQAGPVLNADIAILPGTGNHFWYDIEFRHSTPPYHVVTEYVSRVVVFLGPLEAELPRGNLVGYLDGNDWGRYPLNASSLAPGQYLCGVRVYDRAGNSTVQYDMHWPNPTLCTVR